MLEVTSLHYSSINHQAQQHFYSRPTTCMALLMAMQIHLAAPDAEVKD